MGSKWPSAPSPVQDLVSIDFFTVPTAQLRVLFVLVALAHQRRRVLHFNVTEHPTAAWTAQQIVDTFPDDTAPAYLLRDRDTIFGDSFRRRVKGVRLQEVLTAARNPWQNPFAERLIGSTRRECLNHVLVLGEQNLRRILTRYFAYYHGHTWPGNVRELEHAVQRAVVLARGLDITPCDLGLDGSTG